jgi:mono/diheme cytochrome c family protein
MIKRVLSMAMATGIWIGLGPAGAAQPAAASQANNARGQALYEAHCQGCHKAQVHWRESKSVRDWASLRAQVRRWQTVARQDWRDEDIEAVSQYLNALYYHYAVPG